MNSSFKLFLVFLYALAMVGCGGPKEDAATESDSNAYICKSCEAKFYTDRDIFAEVCPSCKNGNIAPVVAFVCPKDGTVILTAKAESANCTKCQERVTAIKLPSSKELVAWGATKKTKAETGQN